MNEWTPENIKRVRQKVQMTQEDFAHAIGVTTFTINRWERGCNVPSASAREKLDKFLETWGQVES